MSHGVDAAGKPVIPSRATLCQRAIANPTDAAAQLEAAYACDAEGLEEEAVRFYDSAWKLGVPLEQRPTFLIAYGSTLKNVGRMEESEQILREAIGTEELADAARAFLALTLNAAGKSDEAVAELLTLLLESRPATAGVERFRRALSFYAAQLRRSES